MTLPQMLEGKSKKNFAPPYGFTLFEFIITITLILIIATLGTRTYQGYQQRQALRLTVEEIKAVLTEARTNARINKNASKHGVYFDQEGYYVLFQGETFDEDEHDPEFNATSTWPQGLVTVIPSFLEIIFNQVTGTTTGGMIRVTNEEGQTIDIVINEAGTIH